MTALLAAMTMAAAAEEPPPFIMDSLKLEGGVLLPHASVRYVTYGHLNERGDNAILLPSHYMADGHGYEWLIGKDKALDPERYFLIATELFETDQRKDCRLLFRQFRRRGPRPANWKFGLPWLVQPF